MVDLSRTLWYNGYVMSRKNTYRMVRKDGALIYEHRLIAYDAGLDIEGKIVHHEDEDPTNNSIDNLKVVTRSEHGQIHSKNTSILTTGDYINMPCIVCSRERMVLVANLLNPKHSGACANCAPKYRSIRR